jgi:hypothetical protein
MTKPAKNEAELMERVAEALYDNYDLDLPTSFTLAAIRAAGWAVVPQRQPTLEMLNAAHALKNPGNRDIYEAMIAAAPGVEP